MGAAVFRAAFDANVGLGTVPAAHLASTRNAVDGIHVDAKEIFPAMGALIASAKREVVFESFEWDPASFSKTGHWKNDPTMQILDGLTRLESRLREERARGETPSVPVKVYFTIDGPARGAADGNWAVDKVRNLCRQLDGLKLDPSLVEVHVAVHERKVWGASHSKLLVVDGYRAMTTGANPQRFNTLSSSWHDTAFSFRGEAGVGLRRSFDVTWSESQEITSIDLS
ncbi:MAG: hypothetical protein AB1938_14305 [Myxococcota bacterium]